MKRFFAIAALFTCLLGSSAQAEEFYVELGRAPTEAEAQAMWEQIQPQHKVLAKYKLFPNQILQSDGSSAYRVQAGPMEDKTEAQRVCRRLFRKQISCFVIEGFDPNNTKTFDNQEAKTVSRWDFLPWYSPSQSNEVSVPAPVAEDTTVPAPVEVKSIDEPKESKESKESKAAKVDVAEAIPVPVTEGQETNEVTVSEPTSIWSSDNSAPEASAQNGGWLSIQPFLDAQRAQQFWQKIKAKSGANLTAQVIHPVVSHDIPKVILALGTFGSEAEAMQFCRDNIADSNYLECQFSEAPPQGDDAANSASVSEDEYSLHWVQVLSEKSQDRALEKWEKIRTDNDDLLSDVRSQITASINHPGRYVVRIGPMKTKTKATELCGALKARKVACSIVSL